MEENNTQITEYILSKLTAEDRKNLTQAADHQLTRCKMLIQHYLSNAPDEVMPIEPGYDPDVVAQRIFSAI